MNTLSNLPPGVTNRDIEEAAGAFDEGKSLDCPLCEGCGSVDADDPELKLLRDIAEYFDNHYDGAPDSSHVVLEMGKFIGPLNALIERINK